MEGQSIEGGLGLSPEVVGKIESAQPEPALQSWVLKHYLTSIGEGLSEAINQTWLSPDRLEECQRLLVITQAILEFLDIEADPRIRDAAAEIIEQYKKTLSYQVAQQVISNWLEQPLTAQGFQGKKTDLQVALALSQDIKTAFEGMSAVGREAELTAYKVNHCGELLYNELDDEFSSDIAYDVTIALEAEYQKRLTALTSGQLPQKD